CSNLATQQSRPTRDRKPIREGRDTSRRPNRVQQPIGAPTRAVFLTIRVLTRAPLSRGMCADPNRHRRAALEFRCDRSPTAPAVAGDVRENPQKRSTPPVPGNVPAWYSGTERPDVPAARLESNSK